MKHITSELFQELRKTATNIVAGWLVTLPDSTRYGFTTSSTQFVYDGVTYSPINGFSPTAIQSKTDLSVGNMEMTAVLDGDFTEEQLRGGFFDGAIVQAFWISPEHPEYGVLPLQMGLIGQVDIKQAEFVAELRSLSQLLQQPLGRVYSLYCDAQFGDKRCGFPLTALAWTAGMQVIAQVPTDARYGTVVKPGVANGFWYLCTAASGSTTTVTSTESVSTLSTNSGFLTWLGEVFGHYPTPEGDNYTAYQNITVHHGATGEAEPAWPTVSGGTVEDGQVTWTAVPARSVSGSVSGTGNRAVFVSGALGSFPINFFQYGTLTWTSGQNVGLEMDIAGHTVPNGTASIMLLAPMPNPITKGDTFTIVKGCARTRTACLDNANIANMRGMPDMPTEDLALTTPNYSSDYNRGKK